MATDCFPSDLHLRVLLRGFAALRALKKPGDEPGALRVSSKKVNVTSLSLASGRCLDMGTSLRALLTRWVWPLGMNSTHVIGASGRACCAEATKEISQSLSRNQHERNVVGQRSSAEGGECLGGA